MRVIAKSTLRAFWQRYPDAEGSLLAWYREVEKEGWDTPAKVKQKYGSASFVGDRIVFNIKGNKYRLVVHVNFGLRIVLIKFVGTHKQYDAIDVKEIQP
jgi:mRNA interferase HigB